MKKIYLFLILSICSLSAETVLNFSNSNNQPERKAVIRYLLDAFELYNSDIKVNLIGYNENEHIDDILAVEPDIIMADSRLLHRISTRGLLDFSTTEDAIERLGTSDFYSGGLASLTYDNRAMAVPYSAWLQIIWYRKDWFDQAGLKSPNSPENIKKAASYFYKPSESQYGIIMGSTNEVYLEQCFLQLAEPNGFKLKSSGNSWYVNRGVLIDGLNYYKSLLDTSPDVEINWRARDFYFQDKAAMLIYSTHLMDDMAIEKIGNNSLSGSNFEELNGAEYSGKLLRNTGMITAIKGSELTSFGSISGLGIIESDNRDVVEAQKKLINFLYREDVYITWLHMSPGGMLPVYKPVLENDNFYRDPAGVFKRYGRDRIVGLTNGIEHITLLNTEVLEEGGIQKLVYNWLQSDEPQNTLLDREWIKE